MPDIHDQALDWANQNPDDPRAKDIQAKAWAAQNPNDPRSAQVLQKIQAKPPTSPQTPAQTQPNPFDTANNIEKQRAQAHQNHPWTAAIGDALEGPGAAMDQIWKGATLGNWAPESTDYDAQKHPNWATAGKVIGGILPAVAAGTGAGALMEGAGVLGAGSGVLGSIGNALARIGIGTGVAGATGLAKKPDSEQQNGGIDIPQRLKNAGSDAAWGLGAGATGEAVGGIASLLKPAAKDWGASLATMRSDQADAYMENPELAHATAKELRTDGGIANIKADAARQIQGARNTVKQAGLDKSAELANYLKDKTVSVDASKIVGVHPESDAFLAKFIRESNPGGAEDLANVPDQQLLDWASQSKGSLEMPANSANDLKRILQESAKYNPGTLTDPVQSARFKNIGQQASTLKNAIEELGVIKPPPIQSGPDWLKGQNFEGLGEDSNVVQKLNKEMQDNLLLQKQLKNMQRTTPIASLTSDSLDKVADIARVDQDYGTSLGKYGSSLGAAKKINPPDIDDASTRKLTRMLGRTVLRGAGSSPPPGSLNALMDLIYQNKADTQE